MLGTRTKRVSAIFSPSSVYSYLMSLNCSVNISALSQILPVTAVSAFRLAMEDSTFETFEPHVLHRDISERNVLYGVFPSSLLHGRLLSALYRHYSFFITSTLPCKATDVLAICTLNSRPEDAGLV
jgi:hypothetical protein